MIANKAAEEFVQSPVGILETMERNFLARQEQLMKTKEHYLSMYRAEALQVRQELKSIENKLADAREEVARMAVKTRRNDSHRTFEHFQQARKYVQLLNANLEQVRRKLADVDEKRAKVICIEDRLPVQPKTSAGSNLDEAGDLGRRLLEKALAAFDLKLSGIGRVELGELLSQYGFEKLEELLEDIGEGNRLAVSVARYLVNKRISFKG